MRPKLVAGLLAGGIIVLIGGGVFVASSPTWHPATSGGAKANSRAAAASGAVAITQAAHPAASSASTGLNAATGTRAANTTHARTVSRRHVSNSAPSHVARAARRTSSMPSHAARSVRRGGLKPSVTYTVKPGDTLSGIAEWFKLHGYGSLYAANRSVIGSNPNVIFAGERITISHGVMSLHAKRQPRSAS
jgi:nucleoid-associated protein YgaU